MDAAPLTAAHSLAHRLSSTEERSSQVSAAQHQDAAAKYEEACDGIEDSEALRILQLLGNHHRQIARIINSKADHTSVGSTITTGNTDQRQTDIVSPMSTVERSRLVKHQRESSTSLQRRPPRDLSASIASNLASARGIPRDHQRRSQKEHPALAKHHTWDSQKARALSPSATQHHPSKSGLDPGSTNATGLDRQSKSPFHEQTKPQPAQALPPTDAAFHKFYNRFEGLLSKLSAPLAFAGLPLVPEDDSASSSAPVQTSKHRSADERQVLNVDADVNSIFSKAALRAVRDESGPFPGVQESFYVVPTTGGTVSYAGMIARQSTQSSNGDGEQIFVDAQETPMNPHTPSHSGTGKTTEELEMENDTLKALTDELSRRLYDFEKNAQNQTSALQRSIALRQKPPASLDSEQTPVSATDIRVQELEEQLLVNEKELERYGRENEKLKTVVSKYRERWDMLKAGARGRRGPESGKDAGG